MICHRRYRKAHPDEKGTESGIAAKHEILCPARIARPIPMKRELKASMRNILLPSYPSICHG